MDARTIDRQDESRRQAATGVVAAIVTVLIWSLWIVTTRQAATVHLSAAWLGIIRFAVPAVALVPFWWRLGLLPRGVPVHLMAMMVAGAGAPYFVLVATGMHYASAAESGVLLGGTMPLFAALFSAVIDRERFCAGRLAGFSLVVIAMAAIGGVAVVAGPRPWPLAAGRRRGAVGGLHARLPAERPCRAACRRHHRRLVDDPAHAVRADAGHGGALRRGAGGARRRGAVAGRALRHRGARLLRHGGAHPRLLAGGAARRPAAGGGGACWRSRCSARCRRR